jgi:heat-inducible transcriptional repressor
MISERQEKIIKLLVKEYIKNAEPISSKFLAEKYDFGICPSAIRIEFQFLIKEGFLEQPHTSAGRIPTDKAYRFFVNSLKEKREEKIEEELEEVMRDIKDKYKIAAEITKYLSIHSSGFAVFNFLDEEFFIKEGLEELFKNPEAKDHSFVLDFFDFIKTFEENIEKINPEKEINIYIGKENPISKEKNITLIYSECNFPRQKGFISILGPKRMDYEKNIKLINALNNVLKELI